MQLYNLSLKGSGKGWKWKEQLRKQAEDSWLLHLKSFLKLSSKCLREAGKYSINALNNDFGDWRLTIA